MATKPATKLIDALTARTHLGEIMDEVERDQVCFVASRRGRPKFMLTRSSDRPGARGRSGATLVERGSGAHGRK